MSESLIIKPRTITARLLANTKLNMLKKMIDKIRAAHLA